MGERPQVALDNSYSTEDLMQAKLDLQFLHLTQSMSDDHSHRILVSIITISSFQHLRSALATVTHSFESSDEIPVYPCCRQKPSKQNNIVEKELSMVLKARFITSASSTQ